MVQDKSCTWGLPCVVVRGRIARRLSVVASGLSAADCADGRDAAAVVLDRGDSGASEAAQFRAGVLLFVSGAGVFLWGFAAGAECATALRGDSGAAGEFCVDCGKRGVVVCAVAAAAFAR